MKPLISYYGGKQRIASRIVEQVNLIPHTVYAEPFAGGLSVLFAKGKKAVTNSNDYREVINDHDERLINLYRVAREKPDELNRLLRLTLYSQSEYQRAKEWLKDPSRSDLDRAWAYYVNVQMSFAKKIDGGWGTRVYSHNGAYTWASKQTTLPECLDRLKDVHIGCEEALQFIERWDSPQTLFYCDPPYPNTECGHYDGYTIEDYRRLCEALDNCQGSYILSNYAQPIEPQSAQKKVEIKTVMCAAKAKGDRTSKSTREDTERVEILWICDRSSGMRGELKDRLNHYEQKSLQYSLFEDA